MWPILPGSGKSRGPLLWAALLVAVSFVFAQEAEKPADSNAVVPAEPADSLLSQMTAVQDSTTAAGSDLVVQSQLDSVTLEAQPQLDSVTLEARSADRVHELPDSVLLPAPRTFDEFVKPLLPKVRPASAVERQVKVKLNGDSLLQVGLLTADVSRAGLLVDRSQKLGTGYLALNLCQNPEGLPLREMADKLCEKIRNVGFRNLPQGMSRYMSLPRAVDIVAALLRMH